MKERPILFSAPMVRAILDGSKTQTRRIVKPQPNGYVESIYRPFPHEPNNWQAFGGGYIHWYGKCPYGQPGDRLWVRETWGYIDPDGTGENYEGRRAQGPVTFAQELLQEGHPLRNYWRRRLAYAATWQAPRFGSGPDGPARWRPSIHMPRWASRIDLEITGVRVERLQDISEADAMDEGVTDFGNITDQTTGEIDRDAVEAYEALWESLNGPGSWDANPWVWVVEFRRVKP